MESDMIQDWMLWVDPSKMTFRELIQMEKFEGRQDAKASELLEFLASFVFWTKLDDQDQPLVDEETGNFLAGEKVKRETAKELLLDLTMDEVQDAMSQITQATNQLAEAADPN